MSTAPRRDTAIDVARGVAITAIVLGHVDRGLASAGILDADSALFLWSDRFLYSWHLVLFAFFTGLFLPRARDRDGFGGFMRRRVLEWGYLYALWSLLQGTVRILSGDAANEQTSPTELWEFWRPDGQLWFLPWLMLTATFCAAVRPWANRGRALIALAVAVPLALMGWGHFGPVVGTQGLALVLCTVAGTLIGPSRLSTSLSRASTSALVLFGALAFACSAALALLPIPTPTEGLPGASAALLPLGILAAASGAVGVTLLAAAAGRSDRAGLLAGLGRHSLEIFLAHVIAAAGTRALLMRLGVEAPVGLILAGLVAGLALPALSARILDGLGFPWLYRMPRPSRHHMRHP